MHKGNSKFNCLLQGSLLKPKLLNLLLELLNLLLRPDSQESHIVIIRTEIGKIKGTKSCLLPIAGKDDALILQIRAQASIELAINRLGHLRKPLRAGVVIECHNVDLKRSDRWAGSPDAWVEIEATLREIDS